MKPVGCGRDRRTTARPGRRAGPVVLAARSKTPVLPRSGVHAQHPHPTGADRRRAPPIQTFTVGPGFPPDQPVGPIREKRAARVADCHRRFGLSPTPDASGTPYPILVGAARSLLRQLIPKNLVDHPRRAAHDPNRVIDKPGTLTRIVSCKFGNSRLLTVVDG